MNDKAISLIRTWIPALIGALVGFLASKGIELDPDAVAAGTAFMSAVFTGLYYALARWLESRWPKLGWLLGNPKQPEYK